MIDSASDGSRMRTEFQKPTEMPLHSSPVQADDQACAQGSKVMATGKAKMLPMRISDIGLIEVMPMTYSGSRKNSAALTRKAYRPSRAGVRKARRGRGDSRLVAAAADALVMNFPPRLWHASVHRPAARR